MNVTRSRNSGCCSRKMSKAVKPRSTFFDRSARSTRRIRWSRRRRRISSSCSGDLLARGDRVEALGVDRQRVGAHPGLATVVEHRPALEVGVELHQLAAALEEVVAVGARVEADDVVGEQSLEDLLAHLGGQDAPGVRLRPGDVDEVVEEDVGPRRADQRRTGVEVVVVDHHERLVRGPRSRRARRSREVVVDPLVAVLPGLALLDADVRHVRQVPQVVLDEPEDRVRDHVVEAVVGVGVGRDQPDLVGDPVDLDLEPARRPLAAHLDVLLGHRRRDPERVALRSRPGQRRHEAAAAAAHRRAHRPRPARTWPGRGWRADERTAHGGATAHPCQTSRASTPRSLKIFSQSRSRRGIRKCLRTYSLPARPRRFAELGVAQDLDRALRRLLRRVDEDSRTRRPGSGAGCRRRCRRSSAVPSTAPRRPSARSPRASTSGCTTSACDWKALTSIAPTLLRLLRILMSGSPSAYS